MKKKSCNLRITSQMAFCAYPLSMDTYAGCPHGCEYCFARTFAKFNVGEDAKIFESAYPRDYNKLLRLIKGEKIDGEILRYYVNRRQPVHIGGMADPFPVKVEREARHSRGLIEAIGDYPVMWSTKNPLPEYAELMKNGNHIMQCSIIGFGDVYKKIEKKVPSSEERLENLQPYKGKAKKVVVRWQPFIPWLHNEETIREYVDNVKDTADAIVIEFLKKGSSEKFEEMSETLGIDLEETYRKWNHREGTDFLIPKEIKRRYVEMVRKQTDKAGIELYVGENELRGMGDGPNCCGVCLKDETFASKMTFNTSHLLFRVKEEGKVYLEDVLKETPTPFDSPLAELDWNAGTRKGYHEQLNMTTARKFKEYLTTKNQNHPALMFDKMKIKKDERGIYFTLSK